VKFVSLSLCSVWGVTVELRVPPMRGGYPGYAESDRVGETLREFFGVRCGRVKNVSSSLGSIWGVSAELRMPTITGRVPGLPIVLPGWEDPCANFLGFGAVFFWGFWVRCGWVKLVSSSLGFIWGVSAELRMPTHKGEGTLATVVLPGCVTPAQIYWGPLR